MKASRWREGERPSYNKFLRVFGGLGMNDDFYKQQASFHPRMLNAPLITRRSSIASAARAEHSTVNKRRISRKSETPP
jgi:hypothetical protein